MFSTKHIHTLFHIISIILIHIHTSNGWKFQPYHAMEDITTTNTNDNINPPKQNTNNPTNKPNTSTTTTTTTSNPNMGCDSTPWRYNTNTNTNADTNSSTYTSYTVEIYKSDTSPILSYINHTSKYKQVFNPSWIPKSSNVPHSGLMIQVQNCSLTPGECTYCNSTPGLVYTPCDPITGRCDTLQSTAGYIPYHKSLNILKDTQYNSNPSIFYWNNMYYLFKNGNKNTLALYQSTTPKNISSWKQKDAFPSNNKTHQITAPASLLPRNISHTNNKHYLFFGGEGHISVTNSCSINEWKNIDTKPWLEPRPDLFDRDGVESGPSAMKLNDGNYLLLYNGYKIYTNENSMQNDINIPNVFPKGVIPHGAKHYEIGWVILDGTNPTKILQRSNKPLFTAKYNYEIGNKPYTCTQSNSVYAKGIIRLEDNVMKDVDNDTEYFRVYFSAAGSSVGTAVISISHSKNSDNGTKWFEIAVFVSIGCGIFVIVMIIMIWCKNKEGNGNNKSDIEDLARDSQFLSIASTHVSRKSRQFGSHCCDAEISGVNEHGISYVTGSLDSKFNKQNRRLHKKRKHDESNRHNINIINTSDNPNHIHIHTTECYDDNESHLNCQINDNNNNSLTSNISTNSNSTSNSSSCSSCSNNSPTASHSMCCNNCIECNKQRENSKSKSDTMRLSQISFRINETLEKDSPTDKYNTITIAGLNPNDTKFSFMTDGKNFGEPFIQK